MEEVTLKELWKSYNQKVEENLVLNQKNASDISKMKVNSLLSSMKPMKVFALIVGAIWVIAIGSMIINLFVYAYHKVSLFFLYSAAIQVLLTLLAIGVYIYQLTLIHNVDIDEPILSTQEKLARLKTSTLWVTRLLFLQLPVWTTFYLPRSVFVNGNTMFLLFQGIITLTFSLVAIWLFLNIKYENRNKKWFRLIFNSKEWLPILKSMELLEQIDDYKENKKIISREHRRE
ncbi:hypothetical protein [Taibaiella helva]|uniref:hypothetical protein n=1 Tax=Taibaiella helva TaxID=2301235 RepID=UPI000E58496F|nr:hypothetical protein [Taibaiella helva]